MECKMNGNFNVRVIAGAAGAAVFLTILILVLTGNAGAVDDPVRSVFYGMRADWLTPLVKVITYIGNWQSITVLCIILLMLKPTRRTYGIPVSAGAISVTILNKIIKTIVARPRPDDISHLVHAGGFSFPSGHSITSMFVFGMLILLVRSHMQNRHAANILTVVLAAPMICIGLSRIYLGVHYPTDVLAGWSLGIIMIAVISAVFGSSR